MNFYVRSNTQISVCGLWQVQTDPGTTLNRYRGRKLPYYFVLLFLCYAYNLQFGGFWKLCYDTVWQLKFQKKITQKP